MAYLREWEIFSTMGNVNTFNKCSVNIFRQTFGHLLVGERLRQLCTLSCMTLHDSSRLVGIKKLCKEANDMFNSLNVSKEWNIPQKHRTDACFNCGDPDHGVPKCPKPINQVRIDKAKSEFSKNGGGRGGLWGPWPRPRRARTRSLVDIARSPPRP